MPELSQATGGVSAIDPLEVGDPDRGHEIFETDGVLQLGAGLWLYLQQESLNQVLTI